MPEYRPSPELTEGNISDCDRGQGWLIGERMVENFPEKEQNEIPKTQTFSGGAADTAL